MNMPVPDSFLAREETERGWRALTSSGEVIDVTGKNGERVVAPDDGILVASRDGSLNRRCFSRNDVDIEDYLFHYSAGIEAFKANLWQVALDEFDAAIALAATTRARFNRGLTLLHMGRWREGFRDYEDRLDFSLPPLCQAAAERGIRLWRGEEVRNKRLLLVHDAGFGDTVMMLRYVPELRAMGADVRLSVPAELRSLVAGAAALGDDGDFYCPMMSLLHLLDQTAETVPVKRHFLSVDLGLIDYWRLELGAASRRRVGIAWSVGAVYDGDYPRSIPIDLMVDAFGGNIDLFSLQVQGREEAERLGVRVCGLRDFSDVAALIHLMDDIVVIDTAAVHVAGAVGHPRVSVLLPHWSSWRWDGNPFYPWFRLCRQTSPGDWGSALCQV